MYLLIKLILFRCRRLLNEQQEYYQEQKHHQDYIDMAKKTFPPTLLVNLLRYSAFNLVNLPKWCWNETHPTNPHVAGRWALLETEDCFTFVVAKELFQYVNNIRKREGKYLIAKRKFNWVVWLIKCDRQILKSNALLNFHYLQCQTRKYWTAWVN